MSEFWIGYSAAIATYFAIGLCLGVYIVATNLARFHGGGFQWRRMARQVTTVMLLWPMALAEIIP